LLEHSTPVQVSSGLMETDNPNKNPLPWDEVVKTAVHEMRNPLSSMRTAVEILRRSHAAVENHDRVLGMMDNQLDLLAEQLTTLLENPRAYRGD
jgi:nitrogen-specific signal transduction histidine kinase